MSATPTPRPRTRIRPYAATLSENAGQGSPPDQALRGLAPTGTIDTSESGAVHVPKPGDAANDAIGDRGVGVPAESAPAATKTTHGPAQNAVQGDYEVGYGRPPKASQFKPGQSGNPKGRRRGARSQATVLDELMRERMTYTEDGRRKSAPAGELILRRLRNKALKGEDRAIVTLFSKMEALEREVRATVGVASPDGPMPEDDKAIVARFFARELEAARLQDTPHTSAEDDDAAPSQSEENE